VYVSKKKHLTSFFSNIPFPRGNTEYRILFYARGKKNSAYYPEMQCLGCGFGRRIRNRNQVKEIYQKYQINLTSSLSKWILSLPYVGTFFDILPTQSIFSGFT
jgi:hypothetical protein